MHTHTYIYICYIYIYIWECNGTYIDHQFRQEFRPFDQALGETGESTESTELIATLPARCDAAFSAAHSKSLGCGDSWWFQPGTLPKWGRFHIVHIFPYGSIRFLKMKDFSIQQLARLLWQSLAASEHGRNGSKFITAVHGILKT